MPSRTGKFVFASGNVASTLLTKAPVAGASRLDEALADHRPEMPPDGDTVKEQAAGQLSFAKNVRSH